MSFAATRMMAAARRALHSKASTVMEDMFTHLDAVEKANLERLPQLLDPVMRQGAAQDVYLNTRRIKIYANPCIGRPLPDGDIWYDVAWAKNLGLVFIVTSWFGIYDVVAEENQQSDHMSSSLPMPPS
uniref:Uncharacterized protein n=1 Tax=Oryza punctata TaxID=4537 RepID=A0A0E0LG79_ORYPU